MMAITLSENFEFTALGGEAADRLIEAGLGVEPSALAPLRRKYVNQLTMFMLEVQSGVFWACKRGSKQLILGPRPHL